MAAGSIRAGKAYIELGINSKLGAGLKLATRRIEQFGARVSRIGASVRSVGLRLGALGVTAGAGVGVATRIFADFDDQMRLVRAVTGATSAEFAALTEEAKRLGRTTSFTASQVAAGMVEMGRAGFDSAEILDATEQVLALSRATATELPRATEIAGAALRGFALDSSEMQRVADVLTASVNGSAQTLEDFFEGMKYVAPVAVEAGESIEETAAAMAILANNGIKGSLAGNAITRAYKNLSTELKQNELKELGIDAVDAAGNLRPLAQIIADIGAATAGMGSAQRLNIFESLFGRGQAAALKLASGGAQFDSILEGLEEVEGVAVRVASEMDSGIGGAFRRLNSAVEGIAISIGNSLAGELSNLADRLAELSGKVTKFVSENPQFVVMIAKVAAAAVAAAAALVAMGAILSSVGVAFKAVAVAGSVVTAVISGLAVFALNPFTLALGGVLAAVTVFGTESRSALAGIGSDFKAIGEDAKTTIDDIKNAIANGRFDVAGQIAMAGLELAFVRGLGSIRQLWDGWIDDLAAGLITLETEIARVFRNSDSVIGTLLAGVGQATGNQFLINQGFDLAQRGGVFDPGLDEDRDARLEVLEKMRDSREARLARRIQELTDTMDELRREASTPLPPTEAADDAEAPRTAVDPDSLAVEIDIPSADEIAAQIPDIAAGGLQTAADLTGVTRGTFSGFAASRIGTANTYEDQSLKAQQETAQAVKSIDRKVGPTMIGI